MCHADRDSLISIVIPLVVFIGIAASFLWSELRRDKQVCPAHCVKDTARLLQPLVLTSPSQEQEFSDPDTGALYEAGPEMPELDRQGKLVFRVGLGFH